VWNKLLYYSSTRELVLAQNQAVGYLLDLMHDQNDAIRRVCNRYDGCPLGVGEEPLS
jgi:hypothetical protein